MAWIAPRTWTTGEVVVASIFNAHVRDNLLEVEPSKATTTGDILIATGTTALQRVAIGAARSFLRAGTPPAWMGEDHVYPRLVQIDVVDLNHGRTGFSQYGEFQATGAYGGGLLNGAGTLNDEVYWYLVLAQGTWDFVLAHTKGSNVGIYTIYLDGTSLGTIDGYAAAPDTSPIATITGFTVASTGKHTLKVKIESKNASSSGYAGILNHITLIRID